MHLLADGMEMVKVDSNLVNAAMDEAANCHTFCQVICFAKYLGF